MLNLKSLLNRRSYPLNKICLSQKRIVENYLHLSKETLIAPVLKSNAYGHGIQLIGKILDELEVPFLCVDSLYEAYQLQKAKVKSDILIMGYIDPHSLMRKKLPFSYAVYDLKLAQTINDYQKGAAIHIFVDTGMHREGVELKDLAHFISKLKQLEDVHIVGLMSHLAIGGQPDSPLTKQQMASFSEAVRICEEAGLNLKWKHLGGTNAALRSHSPMTNIVRSGIGVYGIDPVKISTQLQPALRLTSKIVQVKEIKKGESTGYDAIFTASKDIKIAILAIGYNDGVDRRLSNKGSVLVKGEVCPIIGFISMNMTTIDVSKVSNPRVGDVAVVFSDNPDDVNSIQNSAKIAQTTPYDLLVHLNPTTRREIQ